MIDGLIGAKEVKIRKDRRCGMCNKLLRSGTKVITASYLLDKKYNKRYREALAEGTADRYRFVPVRHWLCKQCATKLAKQRTQTKTTKTFNFEEIDLNNYDCETQLQLIRKAYKLGQITAGDYEELINNVIDEIAMADAFRDEF